MGYREKLKPGKRVNAFYLPSDPDPEQLEGLQSPDDNPVYQYYWDDKQQKVAGKWVDNDKT